MYKYVNYLVLRLKTPSVGKHYCVAGLSLVTRNPFAGPGAPQFVVFYHIFQGKIGTWIILVEYNKGNYSVQTKKIICIKSARIDGKKMKEDTWYILKNKKFVECK